jgi:hypothetical protein
MIDYGINVDCGVEKIAGKQRSSFRGGRSQGSGGGVRCG